MKIDEDSEVFVGLVEQPLVQHINDYDFDESEQVFYGLLCLS